MSRSRISLIAVLAAAALTVAACGGGDSESTSSGSSDTTAGSGSSGVTTPDVAVGGGFDGSVEACQELAAAFALIAGGPFMAMVAGEQDMTDFNEALADIDARVPSELADEFATIEAAYTEFNEALGGASITEAMTNPAVAERVEQAAESLDDPKVQEAIETVGTFLEDNCTDFGVTDFAP